MNLGPTSPRFLGIVAGALLAAFSASALASSFVPINVPDDWDLSQIDVDADGNYAYTISRVIGEDSNGDDIIEGTLYRNGAAFVRYGPNETYLRLKQFATAGSKVIFRAATQRIEIPTGSCGNRWGVFNGPDPELCPPYTPPNMLSFDIGDRSLHANTAGDILIGPERFGTNILAYAPRLGYLVNPQRWWVPLWSASIGEGNAHLRLLENNKVAVLQENCLQLYARGPLMEQGNQGRSGFLELESESCVDDSLTGGSTIFFGGKINSRTGSLAFCAGPNGPGGPQSVYLLTPGGAPQLVRQDVGNCRVFGSDSAGNVAYGDNAQVFWSDQPDEPTLSGGHEFGDKILSGIGPIAVLSDRTIVAALELRDPPVDGQPPGPSQFGLLFSDGDTDFPPDPNDPADVVLWESSQDGSFFDDQNWNPQTTPDSDQVAVFAPDAAVTVDFGGQTANTEKLIVERGPVTFDGGSYQLNTGSDANPSLILRSGAPGDLAALWLTGGHQLQTRGAMLDQSNSAGGALNGIIIEDDLNVVSPQSRWDNTGRLVVDASLNISWSGGLVTDSLRVASTPGSVGEISVGPTPLSGLACPDISIADFGSVSIGYAGEALMTVERDCAVEATGDRIIGELAGSQGDVTFRESSWIRFYNPGPATKLTVGRFGNGVLNVWDSAVGASDVIIGQYTGSDSFVWVDTPDTTSSLLEAEGTLFVGAGGKGLLRTSGSGRVTAADVTVGAFAGSSGRIFLTGPSAETNLDVAGLLVVGESGNAEMEIIDGAIARSQSGLIGGGAQGRGLVEIATGGAWDIAGDLTLGLSSAGDDPALCDGTELSLGVGELRLQGDGQLADITGQTLTLDGPDSKISGTGLAVFQNTVAINCAVLAPGNSPGTLTFSGNLQLRGGVLEIELSGLGDGEYDMLRVMGDADLSGGIVKFIFDGFLPQQGDQITFVETGGTLNLDDNMRYEYQGANDGFEFDVTTDDEGNITFTANNDAIDLLFGNGFE